MNYQETLDFLFNRLQSFHNAGAVAYKPGLEKAYRLSEAFGNPHEQFKSIHVGGTNGKGSTAHSLASVLMAAGLRVGLYTSPHLMDFRERIRIDGKTISESAVIDFVERFIKAGYTDLDPSFFELTTIMAFEYFAKSEVDIAVVEVGLGGRLDTTNIIRPELAVITNISYDHTALLGNTLAEIAREKSGIIKESVPLVIGRRNSETDAIFEDSCASSVVFAADNKHYSSFAENNDGTLMTYYDTPWGDVNSCLTGSCQPENMATVLTALKILEERGFCRLSPEIVNKGLTDVCTSTGLMGRWMRLASDPEIIADTAHNSDGWESVMAKLKRYDPTKLHIVLGFASDKDFGSLIKKLPSEANYYFVQPSVKRAASVGDIAELAEQRSLKFRTFVNVAEGFEAAKKDASGMDGGVVFVGGSNFVVADLLCYLQNS